MIALTCSLAGAIHFIYRAYLSRRTTRRVLIVPIVYLLHTFIYYSLVLLSQEALDIDHRILGYDLNFHDWRPGLTIHAIITVVFLGYAYLRQLRMKETALQWTSIHKSLDI